MGTNRELSKQGDFISKCTEAGVVPTKRQASKLRNKKGALHNYLRRVGYDTRGIAGATRREKPISDNVVSN